MSNGGRGRLPSARLSGSLRAGLRFAFAVALTGYVLWRSDPGLVLRAAAAARWNWIAVAVGLVLVDRALMAYRWMMLLCALTPGSRPPYPAVLRIFFVSTFVGSFLPSVAGDLYRAYSLSRLRVSGVESAASVVMDRALGIFSMVLVALASLVFARDRLLLPGVLPTMAIAIAGCIVAAAGIYSERVAAIGVAVAGALPGASPKRLASGLTDAIRRYRHHRGELAAVLGASIAVQLIRVLQAFCLGASLAILAPLWSYFLFVPLIVIIMQVPVTVSGLGTSQLAFPLFFAQVGVPAPQAVGLSILFVALGLLGNLPGAAMYVTRPRSEMAQ